MRVDMIITLAVAVFASTGFWSFIERKTSKLDDRDKLLMGIAHDRICYLGGVFIKQGHITKDEYENLHDYLYEPYRKLGGNGTAKKIMEEVGKLPIGEKP